VAAIAAILVPAEAFAQDAAQPGTSSDVGLEEIVVTAQKRAENLQSTPLAISALSAEAIEAR
jgi:iron complex outermembrane receptor protein